MCLGGGGGRHPAGVQRAAAAPRRLSEPRGARQPAAELQERGGVRGFLQLCQGELHSASYRGGGT